MVIDLFIITFLIILIMKIIFDFYYIIISRKAIKEKVTIDIRKTIKILIVIPVLREQNIIENTLYHFSNIKLDNIILHICVAGTSREKINQSGGYITTGDIVEKWIENNKIFFNSKLSFSYTEINETRGDRASQLNYGVKESLKLFEPDIVGVYDADSLPDENTLLEVASIYCENPNIVMQQPVHFIYSANRMSKEKNNPILVANALYQTNWTIIRELSRWYNHNKYCKKNNDKLYFRNDYLIGHGEFIPYHIYKKYLFPEGEVTDGIQLGYRLSMSGVAIKPLHSFCMDDVPQKLSQLIGQHKRWFGGCNRLYQAYYWCKENTQKMSICQMLDGYWSQFSWAYASILAIFTLVFSIVRAVGGNNYFLILELLLLSIYCYIIPYISNNLFVEKCKLRFIDWLCMPVAIAIKGIGPNIYLLQKLRSKLLDKEIMYSKVER